MNQNTFKTKLVIDAELAQAQAGVDKLSESLNSLWKNGSVPKSYLTALESMRTELAAMKELSRTGVVNEEEVKRVTKQYKDFQKEIAQVVLNLSLMDDIQKKGLLSPQTQSTLRASAKALQKYSSVAEKITDNEAEQVKISQQIAEAQKKRASADAIVNKGMEDLSENAKKVLEYQTKIAKSKQMGQKIEALSVSQKADSTRGNELTRTIESKKQLDAEIAQITIDTASIEAGEKEIEELKQTIKNAKAESKQYTAESNKLSKKLGELKADKPKQSLADLKNTLAELGITGLESANTFEELEQAVQNFESQALDGVKAEIEQAIEGFRGLGKEAEILGDKIEGSTEDIKQQDEALAEKKAIVARIQGFLSLSTAIGLTKRAITNAIDTVKELDAVMTDMAVVTDLEVGDYWQQLPEYTDRANELGTAISDVYKASTLYYQQGLKTAEVTALSNETIKMARISGLDTAEATDRMTAALRGFNMELNETNAQNIADVYSKLAAITASDVDEISAAMTKTASIAASAGMEFETTAAFLSQIIETTRESAETAGTAMKTVIARFQELKKDPAEIGEVDGEIVDANKIETALRSVGVALRDTNGQFRDLDDVFIELAQKWDSLDTNTQRYIATIAAGSRQQSRFIAMMSDYSRTQELVTAANNSAGASNEQFEKTMDSLQAKLNQLKNAWDSFSMSIANSDLIKMGVDILTALLTAVNKVTDAFGPLSGVIKVGLLVGALIAASQALNIFRKAMLDTNKEASLFGRIITASTGDIHQKWMRLKVFFSGFAAGFSKNFKKMAGDLNKYTQAQTKANNTAKKHKFATGPLKKYRGDVAKLNELLKKQENQTKKNIITEKLKGATQKETAAQTTAAKTEEVATNIKLAASETAVALTKELTEEQAKDALELTTLGIAADKAAILAKRGINAATIASLKNKLIENGLTEEQAEDTLELTLATLAETGVQKIKNKTDTEGIVTSGGLLGAILGTVLGFGAQTAAVSGASTGLLGFIPTVISAIASLFGITIAENAACPPMIAWTAAILLAGVALLGLIAYIVMTIAAIGILVVAFIGMIKLVKEFTAEKRLEKQAEEQAKKLNTLTEALESTKEELEDLKSAREEYDELQEPFSALTEGTKEWTAALIEANDKVLDLLQTYPQLSEYIQRDNGRLLITDEGWDALIDSQQDRVISLQASRVGVQTALAGLEVDKAREPIYEATGGFQNEELASDVGKGVIAIGETASLLAGIGAGLLSGVISSRGLTGFWGGIKTGLTTGAKVYGGGTAITGVASTIATAVTAGVTYPIEKLQKTNITEFAKLMNEKGVTLDGSSKEEIAAIYEQAYGEQMTDEMYDNLMDNSDAFGEFTKSLNEADIQLKNYTATVAAASAQRTGETDLYGKIAEKMLVSGISSDQMEQLRAEKKSEAESMFTKELMTKYAEIMNYTYKDGKMYNTTNLGELDSDHEIKINRSAAEEIVMEELVLEEMDDYITKASKTIEKSMKNMTTEQKKQFSRVATGDISQMTAADIQKIQEAGGYKQYLTKQGIDISELPIDFSKVQEQINNLQADIGSVRQQVTSDLGLADSSMVDQIFAGLTSKNAKNLQKSLGTIAEKYGQDTAKNLVETIAIFEQNSGLDEEAIAVLNTQLANADMSSADSIKAISSSMLQMGVVTKEEAKKIDLFTQGLVSAGYAINSIDIKKVKQLATTITDMIEGIAAGNKDISQEQYDILKESGVDMSQFVETAEGFRYLGTTSEFLALTTEAANKQFLAARQNFDAAAKAVQTDLEAIGSVFKSTAQQEAEATAQKIEGWQIIEQQFIKIQKWFKEFFTNIGAAIADSVKEILNDIYDLCVYINEALYKGHDAVTNFMEWLVNGAIEIINDIIGWANQFLPDDKKIKTIDSSLSIIDSSEIKAEKRRKKQEEAELERLEKMNEVLEDTTSKLLSLGDSASVNRYVDEINRADTEIANAKAAKKKAQANGASKAQIEQYDKYIANWENYKLTAQNAILSKGQKYDDLQPLVQKIIYGKANGKNVSGYEMELANAIAEKEATLGLTANIEKISSLGQKIREVGKDSEEANQYFEQMALALGFEDINAGADLVRENFEHISAAINGDTKAWEKFQNSVAKSLGLQGTDNIAQQLVGQSTSKANKTIAGLLGSGGYKLVQKTAAQNMKVANIITDEFGQTVVDKNNSTKSIKAGEIYWDIEIAGTDAINNLGIGITSQLETYGKVYQLNQSINQEIRKREQLEHEYNKVLHEQGVTVSELLDNRLDYYDSLKHEEEELTKKIAEERKNQQIIYDEGLEKYKEVVKLNEDGTFAIDYGALYNTSWYGSTTGTEEERALFDEFIDKLTSSSEAIQDNEDAIRENTEAQWDFVDKNKEATQSLEDRVKEALIEVRQKEIDALNDINESINNANEQMISSIESTIDESRQARDNEETEKNIADMESKLAYLRMDTSGMNAMEITQLEEELESAKQDYEDSLVDQAIDKISQANEEAAQQRERQIALAEQQLQAYGDSSEIWGEVQTIMSSTLTELGSGVDLKDTTIASLLGDVDNLKALSPLGQDEWYTDLATAVASMAAYYTDQPEIETVVSFWGNGGRTNSASNLVTTTVKQYKTGGLADFTGPAWLDGTKARPEMVLNAKDTQNFLALRDILAEILAEQYTPTKQETKQGDNYFDIEINVERLESDYDVETLAEKIRGIIYDDAMYRNVNAINQIR